MALNRKMGDELRMWRSHPVLCTFTVGATLGFAAAASLMFTIGPIGVLTSHYLLMLWPTSILGIGDLDGSRTFVIFVMFAQLIGNAVLYGVIFAAPVGSVIAIRRSFGKPERPTSIGGI
jgi:hypothetical protein